MKPEQHPAVRLVLSTFVGTEIEAVRAYVTRCEWCSDTGPPHHECVENEELWLRAMSKAG